MAASPAGAVLSGALVATMGIVAGVVGAAAQSPAPAAAGAQPLPVEAPVPPGTYWTTAAGPLVTYTVPTAWESTDVREGGFAIIRSQPLTGLTVNPYVGVVFADSCDRSSEAPADPTARGVVDAIAAAGGITPLADPTPVTIDGNDGWQLDVRASSECGHLWLWAPPHVGDFHLDDGEAARFVALDTAEGVLVATLETYDPSAWDQVIADAMPIIASIQVDPAPEGSTPSASPGA